jgi:MFS family permease
MTMKIDTNRLLLQFLLLSVISGLGMGMAQIATTLYAISLGATNSQIGVLGGVQGLGFLFTVLPIGYLVDRIGPRKVFLFGASTSSVAYLMFPFVRTVPSLCLFVALTGFFVAFRFISISSVFLEFVRQAGSEKAGWQRGSFSLGLVFLGPVLGGVVSRYWGFDITFMAISASVVVLVILGMSIFPVGARHGDAEDREQAGPQPSGTWIGGLAGMLRNRDILEASLAEALALATFSCFNAFIVVTAIRIFRYSSQIASLFISLEGAAYIGTLFILWRLLAILGDRRFYLASMAFVIIGLISLSILTHPGFLVAGSVLVGLGLGMFNLVNVTRIAGSDVGKGKAAGIFSVFTVIGSIAGPLLGGFAGEWIGAWAIFPVFIPLYLLLGYRLCFHQNVDSAAAHDRAVLIQSVTEEY